MGRENKYDRRPCRVKMNLGKVKTGTGVGFAAYNKGLLHRSFGCHRCGWNNTSLCPHGLKKGEKHANGICSHRILYVKEYFSMAGSQARFAQLDKLLTSKAIEDTLIERFHSTGDLSPELAKHMRNSITLLNQMRRQDEGIKVMHEEIETVDRFRDVIDAKYKELKDVKKQTNRSRQAEDKGKDK